MSRFEFHNGLYLPVVDEIFLYIDDGGLKPMNFEGYSALLIDKSSCEELKANLEGLYQREGVSELHSHTVKGRNLQKYARVYGAAFKILLEILQTTPFRHLVFEMGSGTATGAIKDDIDAQFKKVFDKISNSNIITQHPSIYSHLIFPVNNVLSRITKCDESIKIHLIIDGKYDFKTIGQEQFFLGGQLFDGERALLMTVNAYLGNNLKNGCSLHSINIVKSAKYPVLQIVDGVANLGFNYIKATLRGSGKASPKEEMKNRVFGDFLLAANINLAGLDSMIKEKFVLRGEKIVYLSDQDIISIEIVPPAQTAS